MSLRTALMAAIILGFGGLGVVTWFGLQVPAPASVAAAAAPVPPPSTRILAAAHNLLAGGLLKFDDIQPREVLASEAPAGSLPDTPRDRAELVGSMVRRVLRSQDILLPADILRPGDHGFLAAVLRAGMRATTIAVDTVSGTAGLIWPGDRVDLLLTQVTEDQNLSPARRASAETVLGNVRVIAIDQQLMQGATGVSTEQGVTHTVTLEVSEGQAERVALAARLGHLSLIVRAVETLPGIQKSRPQTTWGGDVSPALNQGRGAGQVMRIYQGAADGKEFRF